MMDAAEDALVFDVPEVEVVVAIFYDRILI